MPNEITLGLNTGPAEAALDRFAGRFNSFASNISRAADSTNAVASALSRLKSIVISFAGVYALESEMQRIDNMRKSADALGVSFERLQQISRAGLVSGISNVDSILSKGILFLEKLRSGEESAVRIGKKLGIGVTAGVEDLIRAVSESPNRILYQRAIFGKSVGTRNIGSLLENVGGVNITEEFAREIERFHDSVTLFRETVTRDILNLFSPLFTLVNNALSSKWLKALTYGVGAYIGFNALGRFLGRRTGVYSAPGIFKIEGGELKAFDLKNMLSLEDFTGYRYTSSLGRVASAFEALRGGPINIPIIEKVFKGMSRGMSTTLLLPAVALFMKGVYYLVSDIRSAAKIISSPMFTVGAGAVGWLYAFKTAVEYRIINIRGMLRGIKNVFDGISDAISPLSVVFTDLIEGVSRGFNFVRDTLKSIAERLFGVIDWDSFSIFKDTRDVKSVSKQNELALIDERLNNYLRSFESLYEALSLNGDAINELAQVSDRRVVSPEIFNFLLDRINTVLGGLSSIDTNKLDVERAEKVNSAIEVLNNYLDQFTKIRERIEREPGVLEKINFRNTFKVDVDEIKTVDELNNEFLGAITDLNDMLAKGIISTDKYNAVLRVITERYNEAFNELPEVMAMNELMTALGNAWERVNKSIEDQWDRLVKSARDIIENINPIERFKGRMYDAVAAFMNGLIDFDALMRYAQGVYRDVFSANDRVNALTGQNAVTSYFTGVFNSLSVPVWSIQQMLQSIMVNGIYLRA